jgi:pepF/M3 family oligoendopeptidase
MDGKLSQTWDLDVFFAGGSDSPAFAAFVEETAKLIAALLGELGGANGDCWSGERLSRCTAQLQEALSRVREAESFVSCLASQRMSDRKAAAWTERIQSMSARFQQALSRYDAVLAGLPDALWDEWRRAPELAPIAYPLEERREAARDKLPPEMEGLAGELAVDGYHGWGEHYQTIVSRIAIPWEENGRRVLLSAGQAANKLEDADPAVRDAIAPLWEEAWAGQADLCADTLNRLAGFRLKLYGMRGWNDPLREPLKLNRMSRETLDAMWEGVATGIEPIKKYLILKARLIGKDRLGWHDVEAPLASDGRQIPFDEAARIIVGAFEPFSPRMAELARRAFKDRWIEAENRPDKRPGGFCTGFPLSRQSRIFMTYSGTPGNVSTLAHELGHAYHSSLTDELPPLGQEYAMNVAETASTFAEAIVTDALLREAETQAARLALLDDRLQRAAAFCMNIRSRFLFETRFYARRAQGMLEAAELCELMTEAQREAFDGALGSWHPHFWASKLHFYLTDVPFYNFPYTFGYLFSAGLLAVAEQEGPAFRDRYDRLLRDTGLMSVEELASRHLGVSLSKPDFWKAAVSRVTSDVDKFEALCSS